MPNSNSVDRKKAIGDRIKLGLTNARNEGVTLGRPRIITPDTCEQVRDLKFKQRYPNWKIIRKLRIGKSTFYAILRLLAK